MKLNLDRIIDVDKEKVINAFKELGWVQEDIGYICTKIEKDPYRFKKKPLIEKVAVESLTNISDTKAIDSIPGIKDMTETMHLGIVVIPRILYYSDRSNRGDQAVVWMKCRFESQSSDDLEIMIKHIKEEVIPKLPWKPFYDEDAHRNNFSRPHQDRHGDWIAGFYLNPDYPKGWWENHTIE